MAKSFISSQEQEVLFERFENLEQEKIGEGVHEHFHELLDNLSRIYLQPLPKNCPIGQ